MEQVGATAWYGRDRRSPPTRSWRRAQLDDVLDGMTPMEFILRFTFTNPDLDTTIVGTINPAHLQTNLDILKQGLLPPDLYEEAKQRLAAAGSVPRAGGK